MTRGAGIDRMVWRAARMTMLWLGALLLLYVVFIRPWHLQWGATETEVGRRMPGDDIVRSPDLDATRGVAIAATAERVWPVLVQRAGEIVAGRTVGTGRMWVKEVEPGRWIVWWDRRGEYSWSWGLYPPDGGGTRLVTRQRARYPWHSPRLFRTLLADAADIVTVRRCLLDIKRRAEASARQASTH